MSRQYQYQQQQQYDFDYLLDLALPDPIVRPPSGPITIASMEDDEIALELDEPPDHYHAHHKQVIKQQTPITPIAAKVVTSSYAKMSPAPMIRTPSLLTEGLTASTLQTSPSMSRAGSQASAYSLSSNHGLTSDGGMSSPTHTGSPSPPLPPVVQSRFTAVDAAKPRTIKFAGERSEAASIARESKNETVVAPQPAPRKTCISFACGPSKTSQAPLASTKPAPTEAPKRTCTIKFACAAKPVEATPAKPVTPPRASSTHFDAQTTPKANGIAITPSRKPKASPTCTASTSSDRQKAKFSPAKPISPAEARRLEKEKLRRQASNRVEDEDWVNEKPKARKPITVTDTLRKEIAIRQLAEEANQEADEDELDDMLDDDDEEDELVTGSNYMAYEDESDGGHETDDEEGFAESDDDDDDPDFQFWTTKQATAATSTESRLPSRPREQHKRTVSESSFDSAFRFDTKALAPPPPLRQSHRRGKSPKAIKMRPGTPELPDSTDFVCGTLDEDRPLEDAYLSCLKQRKLEKQGIIPQDLDPSFPTSDPENNNDEEDEHTERSASTASDHHFLGGRFDESDIASVRGRNMTPKNAPAPMRPSPQRLRSPPPKPRFKSPAPCPLRKPRAKSPAPRKLFGRSPLRPVSPPPPGQLRSPPTSPKGITIKTAGLAQGPALTKTTSLPHTPNPFFVAQARRMRAALRRSVTDNEIHSRGPVDIKQGLEERKQRRKEHYWRKHCRDHKDKSRRCAPGKGAERMRELGLEMANRNRAYGQKLHLMMSV